MNNAGNIVQQFFVNQYLFYLLSVLHELVNVKYRLNIGKLVVVFSLVKPRKYLNFFFKSRVLHLNFK